MEPQKFTRRVFDVSAAQVTQENISEIAVWCKGTVEETKPTPKRPSEQYIQVDVHRPLNERQTRAFVGDWVITSGPGFKVYTDRAFKSCFKEKEDVAKQPAVVTAPIHAAGTGFAFIGIDPSPSRED
jgi:hypothetical protein